MRFPTYTGFNTVTRRVGLLVQCFEFSVYTILTIRCVWPSNCPLDLEIIARVGGAWGCACRSLVCGHLEPQTPHSARKLSLLQLVPNMRLV